MRKPRLVLAALVVPASFTIAASASAGDHGIAFRDYGSGHGWTGSDRCVPMTEPEGGWTCYVGDPMSGDSASTPDGRQPGDRP